MDKFIERLQFAFLQYATDVIGSVFSLCASLLLQGQSPCPTFMVVLRTALAVGGGIWFYQTLFVIFKDIKGA